MTDVKNIETYNSKIKRILITEEEIKEVAAAYAAVFKDALDMGTWDCNVLHDHYFREGFRCFGCVEISANTLEKFIAEKGIFSSTTAFKYGFKSASGSPYPYASTIRMYCSTSTLQKTVVPCRSTAPANHFTAAAIVRKP